MGWELKLIDGEQLALYAYIDSQMKERIVEVVILSHS